MKTIGVTGGTGFIGQHIAKLALGLGYEVIIFDHSKRSSTQKDDFELFLGDVRDKTAVTEFAAHVDGIVHLAAVLGTQETIGNPGPAVETNMLGGINVLDSAKQYSLPLVYAGVGNYWMLNTYSTTKTSIERLLYQYRSEFNCPFATVRPVNAYGPGQRAAPPFGSGKVRKIIPAFVCRAIAESPIEIYGDGTQISDMVYVDDVAKVFIKTLELLNKDANIRHPIEVGPNESLTVGEVADRISRMVSNKTNRKKVDLAYLPMRPGEKSTNDIDQESIDSILNFSKVNLQDHEYQIVSNKIRELGRNVISNASSLQQIGISNEDFVSFDVGCSQTIDWYINNEGVTWSKE